MEEIRGLTWLGDADLYDSKTPLAPQIQPDPLLCLIYGILMEKLQFLAKESHIRQTETIAVVNIKCTGPYGSKIVCMHFCA